MNIAICDDDPLDVCALRNLLTQSTGSSAIECFDTGQALLNSARERRYDLVFMDVFLKEENGLDIVRELNALSPATKVVFTTCSDAHAVDAFSVRALHYLVKPIAQADIAEVMARMESAERTRAPDSVLTVRIGNDIYTLLQSDIVRVESGNHKTNIFMRNGGVYSIWLPFRKVADGLDRSFLNVSRGVAVNMRHIVRWQATGCQMVDGTAYLLSRNNRAQMKQTYYDFKQDQMLAGEGRTV